MAELAERRMAVLIDGDNAQPGHIGAVLKECIRYGIVTIKRIYADFTNRQMEGWKQRLSDYAVQPIQQFRNTIGKNATDSAMIIDAMDILYGGAVDGFVIVSSDSDYTRLALRIRESGRMVIGIGQDHTPRSFVNACDEFRFVENIASSEERSRSRRRSSRRKESTVQDVADDLSPGGTPVAEGEDEGSRDLVSVVGDAIDMADGESDWVDLRTVANNLKKLYPEFDPRTYGNRRLSKLIQGQPESFQMKRDREKKRVMVRLALDSD